MIRATTTAVTHGAMSRRELVKALAPYSTSNTAQGLRLFLLEVGQYFLLLCGVLFLPELWMKLACSIFAGMTQSTLLVLAHDAGHGCLVTSPRLNRALAVTLFALAYYNYRLWIYEHNRLHHPFVNDTKPDAYTPLSKEQYDASPRWRQWLERFYRMPTGISFAVYHVVERYWSTKVVPPRFFPQELRTSVWWYSVPQVGCLAMLTGILALAPAFTSNLSLVTALGLGLFVPFLVREMFNGFTLYVQHTHPAIPWFADEPDRNGVGRVELLSVHLKLPRWMEARSHGIFCHPAHHLLPKIPCYKIGEAQSVLNGLLGPVAIVEIFSLSWLTDVMKRCKLYDWERQQWLDFDGRPTAAALRPVATMLDISLTRTPEATVSSMRTA